MPYTQVISITENPLPSVAESVEEKKNPQGQGQIKYEPRESVYGKVIMEKCKPNRKNAPVLWYLVIK